MDDIYIIQNVTFPIYIILYGVRQTDIENTHYIYANLQLYFEKKNFPQHFQCKQTVHYT